MRLSEHLIKRLAVDEGRNLIKKVDCSHFLDVFFLDTSIFLLVQGKERNIPNCVFYLLSHEGYFSEKK
jgi:hypothetical protein